MNCPIRVADVLSLREFGDLGDVIAAHRQDELQALVERIAERIGRALEREGILARDADNSYLLLGSNAGGPMDNLLASIEEPELIDRILARRWEPGDEAAPTASLGAQAPPQASLF